MTQEHRVNLVIPCFNESKRFDLKQAQELVDSGSVCLTLVDDGSSDETYLMLEKFQACNPSATRLLRLNRNRGKAEALRLGFLEVLSSELNHDGKRWIGFIDADFSTPAHEVLRIVGSVLDQLEADTVWLGSRFSEVSRGTIYRPWGRRVMGRCFAWLASRLLGIPVKDPQCGCKFFSNTSALAHALSDPIPDRWLFDLTVLARLHFLLPKSHRLPLRALKEGVLLEWSEKGGTHFHWRARIATLISLFRLWRTVAFRSRSLFQEHK